MDLPLRYKDQWLCVLKYFALSKVLEIEGYLKKIVFMKLSPRSRENGFCIRSCCEYNFNPNNGL